MSTDPSLDTVVRSADATNRSLNDAQVDALLNAGPPSVPGAFAMKRRRRSRLRRPLGIQFREEFRLFRVR